MLHLGTRILTGTMIVCVVAWGIGSAEAQSSLGSTGGKNAAKCQQTIAKVSAKYLAQRLKRLATCSNGVLACIQTLADATACVTKATSKCRKQFGAPGAPDAAAQKLQDAIVKACGGLAAPDLLSAGGLGFADGAAACAAVGVATLADATDVARCLQRLHDGLSEDAFGAEAPRAAELTALGGVSGLVVPDLPPFDGCGDCATSPPPTGKIVAGCGAAIAKAGASFLAKARAGLDKCAAGLVGCAQTKPGDDGCRAKAKSACEKLPADLTKQRDALVTALVKKCGTALSFATLDAPAGINLGALACECQQVGLEPAADVNAYAQCLARQHECRLAALLPTVVPSLDGLLADEELTVDDLICAPPGSSLAASRGGARAGLFGSILKFVKTVTPGSLHVTTAPLANHGTVRRVGAPLFSGCQPKPGSSCLFRFPITKKPVGSLQARGTAAAPPALVIAVQRADGAFADDHFEVDLADTTNDSEVEVEVTYADDLAICGFELATAVAEDGVVSPYTLVEQTPHAIPPNDACTTPRIITTTTFDEVLDTTAATALVDEPAVSCAPGGLSSTVWYQFTAPANGLITADAFGSNFDSVMAVWTGTCGAPSAQTCADDTGGTPQSKVALAVAQGTTYLIEVGVKGVPPDASTLHFAFRFDAAGEPPTISKLATTLLEINSATYCLGQSSAYQYVFAYQDPDGDVLPSTAVAHVHARFEPSGGVSDFSVFPLTVSGDGFAGQVSLILCNFFSQDASVTATFSLGDLAGTGNELSVKTTRPPGGL